MRENTDMQIEKAGAALVELDNEPNDLWNKVQSLLSHEEKLKQMSVAAKSIGMPDAADQIAKVIIDAEC